MILLEDYLKEKEKENNRIIGNILTPIGIISKNIAKGVQILDVKNLVLNKGWVVPQIKKYLEKLDLQPELINFLSDILIIVSSLSKKNKQSNAKFESVFLDGEPDQDYFVIKLTDAQSKNLEALNLNRIELNTIGKTFEELISGIFLMNRYEPIKKIKYPLSYNNPLVDFFAITDTGLEYKISAKYKKGKPNAIKSILDELKPYVDQHKATNPQEEKAENFIKILFNILEKYPNPVFQIITIYKFLVRYFKQYKSFFEDNKLIESFENDNFRILNMNSTQIINYIIDNNYQKDLYRLFKKIVFILNNDKEIIKVFNRWISYANIHQVYIFDFYIQDLKTIKILFKLRSFKHKDSRFEFATKANIKTPWKNGINFKMVID